MREMFMQNRNGRGGGGGRGQGTGRGQGAGRGQGRGIGGGNRPGSGPGGNCVCPQCGKKVPHVAGQRCADQVCPDCGVRLVKE